MLIRFIIPISGWSVIVAHILLVCLITSCSLNYEQIVITGTVTDLETKTPIIGATIIGESMFYDSKLVDYDIEADTVTTDFVGKFELEFKKGVTAEIRITALGYLEKEYLFNFESNRKHFRIELERVR